MERDQQRRPSLSLEQIREARAQAELRPTDESYWLSLLAEIGLGIRSEIRNLTDALASGASKQEVQQLRKRESSAATRTRKYWVVEFIPALPPKFDAVYDRKPADHVFHHVITGRSKTEAIAKLTERLIQERSVVEDSPEEQAKTQETPEDK